MRGPSGANTSAELLWEFPDDPRGSLRWSLSKLRGLVDADDRLRIVADRSHVRFDAGDVAVDVTSLRALKPAFRCSATLISPTYVLTAGHCASNFPDGEYSGMRIFTESDVQNGDNNYPFAGPNSVEAVRSAAHPLYPTAPFFVHDVGMVELAEPVILEEYGELPEVNSLDRLKTKRGLQNVTFTSVGYGLQQINPVFIQSEKIRMVAHPHLIQINVPGFTGDTRYYTQITTLLVGLVSAILAVPTSWVIAT